MKQAPKEWFKWEAIQKADGKAQCPTACTKTENNIQEYKGNYTNKKKIWRTRLVHQDVCQ